MPAFARRLFRECCGATVIEYALIAALITIVIVAGTTILGDQLMAAFSTIASNL